MENLGSSRGLSTSDLNHASSKGSDVDELRSGMNNLELQLAKSKEEKAMILHQLEETADALERTQKQIGDRDGVLHEKDRQIKDYEFRLEQLQRKSPQVNLDVLSFQAELKKRDDEIKELREIIRNKDKALESVSASYHLEYQRLRDADERLVQKTKTLENLQVKIKENENNIDNLYLSKRSEGTMMLEIEHFKADNARLLRLLKSTNEFKEFGEFAEASNGVRYLPQTNPTSHYECAKTKTTEECDDWIPLETARLANEFLTKYGNVGFKSHHMNRFLEDLNKAWRAREKCLMSIVRSKCMREVETLRRKLATRPSYSQVQSETQITRLKTDLKKAHSDLRGGRATLF